MQLTPLGKSDLKISPILMGTWQAGKEMWVGIDDAQSTSAIRAAFEAGITTFDTAEAYGNGHSERVLGAAVSNFRDRVILATKVFANHLEAEQVIAACHRSLKNLKTDSIDLYQIHWPAGSFRTKAVPIAETMGALNQLKEQGKIRAIGVSNFSRRQLEEASQHGRIDSLQSPYSLFWRHVENDALPYCVANDITLLAYSPMAQGLLTGKFAKDHKFEEGDHRARNRLFKPKNFQRVHQALDMLRPLAEEKKTSPGQLALAWVISHAGSCAIAGARNPAQAAQNAAAADLSLSDDDLARLDDIGRLVTDYLDDDPMMWNF
ncbi:MAG: aldo/keto reductase [Desulfobacteraceae bacterium]|jgi:aryl-alcohol dehydrogenase-like predicted oxidoreductase|nr:aldo/keto reductase [Desulfobacteraceae bacterium]